MTIKNKKWKTCNAGVRTERGGVAMTMKHTLVLHNNTDVD